MDKEAWFINTVEYYSAIKKEILSFVTAQMNLEDIMLSEISQAQKDEYLYVESKKVELTEQNPQLPP